MTAIGTTPNPYAQYGSASAYARAAATPSLAATLSGDGSAGDFSASNAATNLTLSDAARAQLAKTPQRDFATVTSDARVTLDRLYTVAGVKARSSTVRPPSISPNWTAARCLRSRPTMAASSRRTSRRSRRRN